MAKEIVFTEQAPKAVGPYVQAVKEGNIVYCSGQLGIDVDAGDSPARSCVQVAALPLGGLVEIECVAKI